MGNFSHWAKPKVVLSECRQLIMNGAWMSKGDGDNHAT